MRYSKVLRFFLRFFKKIILLNFLAYIIRVARNSGGYSHLLRKIWYIYRVEGYRGILRRLPLKRSARGNAEQFFRYTSIAHELVGGDCSEVCPKGGIAVIVHAYYPELFESIVVALNDIPWPFDLYVSVTNDEARLQVCDMATRLERAAHVEVQVTPNRGRDIAPFLVTYAAAIRAHRYVLHIHTKKSLYSGRERTEWRDYLIKGLLGGERRIRQIFSLFEREPKLGIVYPDTFGDLPYWAHTWLQNRGIGLQLGARLNIDISHSQYIDAPLGSMFWARNDALYPLIDLCLGYNDFPEECGQSDGTLQHTIERFFVLAAQHAGYGFRVMLDAENNSTLFICPGRKNLAQYFAGSIRDRILAMAPFAQIVSFDIFDTLLVRPWLSPDHLFSFLEQMVAERFGIKDFAHLRKKAEHFALLKYDTADVNITQIYDALGDLIDDSISSEQILMLELEIESAILSPRDEVCDAARALAAQGKRMVLVSDMYLDESFLSRLLASHDLDIFEKIYVSNEFGARKDTGTMWQLLPAHENVSEKQWLHVGDNEHSDLQRPLDAGFMHPIHVMRAADQFLLFNEDAASWMLQEHWQEGLLLGLLANRLFLPNRAASPIGIDGESRRVEIRSLRDFGYLTIGPALTVFMAWLLGRARVDRVELLLYASREGHLLKQAHDLIFERLSPSDVALPAGAYFLCSRASAGLAAIQDNLSLELLLDAHFNGSFGELLSSRYCIENLAPFVARLGEEAMQRPIVLPLERPRAIKQLGQCLDLISAQSEIACERYRRYAHGLIANRRSALVDIGYSGTIQKALASVVEGIVGGYYFVTTDKARCVDSLGQFAKGCFGDFIDPFRSDVPLYQYSLLFEAVLTAPHGQLLGFDAAGAPRYKSPGLAQRHFTEIEEIHAGALEFLDDALRVVGPAFSHLGSCHRASQLPIRQVMECRWQLDFDLSPLHVEDDFSGNSEISIFEFYKRQRERT
ncbi:HAD-IA family hydrolase [Pseudomonas saponiphila]|nr:HAD-IA family hydrolase [Pseudomonas saponiphila]